MEVRQSKYFGIGYCHLFLRGGTLFCYSLGGPIEKHAIMNISIKMRIKFINTVTINLYSNDFYNKGDTK